MHPAGPVFTILESVDSTNNYAMGKVHAGLAKHGDACFTMHQTQGRGQRGRQWQTKPGENIAISIVIIPSVLSISQQFLLSAAVAIATHNFFNRYAGFETTIKWPNDIMWRDRKAAGILIENIIGHEKEGSGNLPGAFWKCAVVGIGVNINQTVFDPALKNPVSLKQITGRTYDCIALAKVLHLAVVNAVNTILPADSESIIKQYNQQLYKRDCRVRLRKSSVEFDTIIKSVSEDGQLHTTDLIDNSFSFGEVEWII